MLPVPSTVFFGIGMSPDFGSMGDTVVVESQPAIPIVHTRAINNEGFISNLLG
jgi:hypothetical protein